MTDEPIENLSQNDDSQPGLPKDTEAGITSGTGPESLSQNEHSHVGQPTDSEPPTGSGTGSKSLPKWEYMVTTKQTERHMILELKLLGAHGWEAFSTSYNKDLKDCWCWTTWLKRPWTGLADTTGDLGAGQGEAEKAPLAGFDLSEGDFEFKD